MDQRTEWTTSAMITVIPLLFLTTALILSPGASNDTDSFVFNGFAGANLRLDGVASVTPVGLLRLTEPTTQGMSHAFFPHPLPFKNSSSGAALSFSTSFVFAVVPKYYDLTGHGIALVLSASEDLSHALPSQYIGLFNESSNDGDPSNHLIAVELDTNYSPEFADIDSNHVGIDVNSLRSVSSVHASYFSDSVGTQNLSLSSGKPIQVWVEYDQFECLLNVTVAPVEVQKPSVPLLSSFLNLSSLISDYMHIGFSSATGSFPTSHYILAWNFALNGRAQDIDLTRLPMPEIVSKPKEKQLIKFGLPSIAGVIILVAGISLSAFLVVRRRIKYAELLEDWELEYGPQRFSYKDLYMATKGFREKELMGAGGFGRVYKGVLPGTSTQVAVKKISHETRYGMRQFVAEIITIGRLRHRNLVRLLGYCRRKGELLLVYDFMPNCSLDKLLFDKPESMLDWRQRLHIIRGVASGLLYLHEEWDQVVIHRDIKASNILLDAEMNGRLGDFGLSRLYDHGTDPQTTHVVGTLGYLAPELPRTGKATTCTDVYAFGGFLLEMACGRRPIETKALPEEMILVDWVLENWKKGSILEARDPNLSFNVAEMELVLKLGLLCSHPNPKRRPHMRLVMQVLDGDAVLTEDLLHDWSESSGLVNEGLDEFINMIGSVFSRSMVSSTESSGSGTVR